jgi:leucyl/phenylalanyl-tRNA--protein transferase
MPVYKLGPQLAFPPPEGASPEGVVAIGGDLSPERILLAYSQGIFPWPHRGLPLLWFSPDPRFVLELHRVHVGRSLRRRLRDTSYAVTMDTAFEAVIEGCATGPRPGQEGTWITDGIRRGFTALHGRGFAHSVEAWQGEELVGGLYGVAIGHAFTGESMFARAPDASKVAFVTLLGNLLRWTFRLIDCQVETEHLARFGASAWPRARFLAALREAVAAPTRHGPWRPDLDPAASLAALDAAHASDAPSR